MGFEKLSEADMTVVGEALRAAAEGPFFPDWEFHTLFGLDRSVVRAIADSWPVLVGSPEDTSMAVNNSLTMLLGYPPVWTSSGPTGSRLVATSSRTFWTV